MVIAELASVLQRQLIMITVQRLLACLSGVMCSVCGVQLLNSVFKLQVSGDLGVMSSKSLQLARPHEYSSPAERRSQILLGQLVTALHTLQHPMSRWKLLCS